MTSPMYKNSVPVFRQMLTALQAILAGADAHAAAHAIEPDAYLQARLYPDMFPLVKQVQIAADFARGVSARLAQFRGSGWPVGADRGVPGGPVACGFRRERGKDHRAAARHSEGKADDR